VEPKLFARYRSAIVDGLRRVLAGEGPLRNVLRVHVGLEDETGASTCALGKLVRPSLTLLIAEEMDGDLETALTAAVALELVHEFSLIHDDVQDADAMRRGRPTIWSRCGESQAINAGDLMLTLALREAATAGEEVLGRLLEAVIEMVEGQVLDVSFGFRWPSLDESTAMIDRKTGALFRCACDLGTIVAEAAREARNQWNVIGRELGRAVQIRDDLLGIFGGEARLGKPIGTDIRRRKKSYPLLLAMADASATQRRAMEEALEQPTVSDEAMREVVAMMASLDVWEAGAAQVNRHLENVLSELQRSPCGEVGLAEMTEWCESLRIESEGGPR